MTSFGNLFTRQTKKIVRPRFFTDLKPHYPPVDELIQKAERSTLSCKLSEQIDVSRLFYKEVAIRGLNSRRYSVDEARKAAIIIDHISEARRRQLSAADAI